MNWNLPLLTAAPIPSLPIAETFDRVFGRGGSFFSFARSGEDRHAPRTAFADRSR